MYHLPTKPISTRHHGQVKQKQLNKAPEPQHGSHVLPLHSGFFQRYHISSHYRHGFATTHTVLKSLWSDLFFFSGHDTPWPLGPGSTRHGVMEWVACRVAVSAIVDAILQLSCIWRIPLLYAFVDVLPRKGQREFSWKSQSF